MAASNFVLLVALLLLNVFYKEVSGILGGKEVGVRIFQDWKIVLRMTGEYPYMAAVEHKCEFKCGAVIIQLNALLTVAHCVKGIPGRNLRVRAGTFTVRDKVGKNFQKRKVLKKVVHENFVPNSNDDFDIAILKLQDPFEFSDFVKPIKLVEENQVNAFDRKSVIAIGFGEMEGCVMANHLRSAKLKVISKSLCKDADNTITDNMLCTRGEEIPAGICNGDSGGPLIANHNPRYPELDVLIGIASFAISQRDPPIKCYLGKPSVFTDVAVFRSWIDEKL